MTRDIANPHTRTFVGNDGADLLGRLSKSQVEENSIGVSADPNPKPDIMQRSIEELLHEDSVDTAKKYTGRITEGFKTANRAAGSVLGSSAYITKLGLNKIATSPSWMTSVSAAVGLVAGVKALKNILKSVSVMIRPMQDPNVGWLPRLLQGLLQGGLFFGLTSSFFGRKNLFTEHVDGKPIVRVKTLVGATLAPFIFGIFMKLAEGRSLWRKVPLIGEPLEDICKTVFGATREVTVATESNPQAQQAGMPNTQMAA